jgi:Protein of unknown function (DUF3341)
MTSVVAGFEDRHTLQSALRRLREADLSILETYTPGPLDGGSSILPLIIFLAGVLTTLASFALQTYANVFAYSLDIGARPAFSWPSFIPIALENGILAAVAVGFFGYLAINRLPRLYEPIDESEVIRRASRDLWCVAVRTERADLARSILRDCGADRIEVLPE